MTFLASHRAFEHTEPPPFWPGQHCREFAARIHGGADREIPPQGRTRAAVRPYNSGLVLPSRRIRRLGRGNSPINLKRGEPNHACVEWIRCVGRIDARRGGFPCCYVSATGG